MRLENGSINLNSSNFKLMGLRAFKYYLLLPLLSLTKSKKHKQKEEMVKGSEQLIDNLSI